VRRRAKKNARRRRACRLLVAPQGFEPRLSESESLVLPLNEGAPATEMLPESRKGGSADCPIECNGLGGWGQTPVLIKERQGKNAKVAMEEPQRSLRGRHSARPGCGLPAVDRGYLDYTLIQTELGHFSLYLVYRVGTIDPGAYCAVETTG
jgi:hypothetical protein